jgi:glutathione S-transferase
MPIYTALVTLLAVALYFSFALRVAMARGKFGVQLPATLGNADFERVFRVHQNTHEWLPIFLATLWVCALFLSDIGAAAIGVLWLLGRLIYAAGYTKAVEKRLPSFFIQSTACILLFLGAAVGVARHLIAG